MSRRRIKLSPYVYRKYLNPPGYIAGQSHSFILLQRTPVATFLAFPRVFRLRQQAGWSFSSAE